MSGLYVHTPFCRTRCIYCDFNAYAGCERLVGPYGRALLEELQAPTVFKPGSATEVWARSTVFTTVYFGGGNPALLGPYLTATLKQATADGRIAPDAEVSLELNPEDAEAELLESLLASGFNRLSLGWQVLDDAILAQLCRRHDSEAALASLPAARAAGFKSVNIDLIFGLPGQTSLGWRSTLERAVAAGPDHISTYSLTIEPGTPLAKLVEGSGAQWRLPAEDETARMYEEARDILARAGFEHYEISNFARPGHRCRHNINYWQGGDYLGIGAGAHSHHHGLRWWCRLAPEDFIDNADRVQGFEELDDKQRLSERIFLGLRMIEGVDPGEIKRDLGLCPEHVYSSILKRLRSDGMMIHGPKLALTSMGLPLADAVMTDFM